MFKTYFVTLFALIQSAFKQDKKLQMLASIAGGCFLLSIASLSFLAYLSQPIYNAFLAVPSPVISWTISIGIAFFMSMLTTHLGTYIADRIAGRESLIEPPQLAVPVILFFLIGGIDIAANYKGSEIRAEKNFKVETFTEHKPEKQPFQAEIDKIDEQIEGLKVMYKGKMTVAWNKRDQHKALLAQRANFIQLQTNALKESMETHSERKATQIERQALAQNSFKWLSVLLYVACLFLVIPIADFIFQWDMMDGQRDGKNSTASITHSNSSNPKGFQPVLNASERQQIGFKQVPISTRPNETPKTPFRASTGGVTAAVPADPKEAFNRLSKADQG